MTVDKNMNTLLLVKFRPTSDAILQTSQIEFDTLSLCEVQHLSKFRMADLI